MTGQAETDRAALVPLLSLGGIVKQFPDKFASLPAGTTGTVTVYEIPD